MLESINFSFDGESSVDYGVMIVKPNGGLYNEPFLPTRRIVESSIPFNNTPYFKRVEDAVLSFTLSLYIVDWEKRNNLIQIAEWLYKPQYKQFHFETNPDRKFYVMFQGNSDLNHNGAKQGYINVNIRLESPYTYSPLYKYNNRISGTKTVQLANEGSLPIRPNIKITKIGNGNISIKNNENQQVLTINQLLDGEVVTIDCKNEFLISSYEERLSRYLFDNHNDVWLDWEKGKASFTFEGQFNLEFSYEWIYLQDFNVLSSEKIGGC